LKRITSLFLFFSISLLWGQNQGQHFTAFGHNPTIPNDSLFININQAKGFDAIFNATQDLIVFHKKVGNIDSIIMYANRLHDQTLISGSKNKTYYLATTSQQIGDEKLNKGLFDDALKWYLSGIEYSKDLENKVPYYKNEIGFAISKFARNDKREGIEIIKECIEKAPNAYVKYKATYNFAKMLYFEGKHEEARENFEESLNYYQTEEYPKEELSTLLNLGIISNALNENNEALDLFFKVFNKAMQNQYYDLYISSGNAIGELYLKLEDYDNAIKILTTTYANALQWENLQAQRKVLNTLRLAHSKISDYKNAYALMTQLKNLETTILNNQNKSQVNELEVRYETREKEQEIDRQKTLKQNILIGFLIILLPSIALLYVYYQKLQTQSKLNKTLDEINQQKITSLIKDQQLKLITASVEGEEKERKRIAEELHDSIGGNLASIKLQLSSSKQQNVIKQIDDTYNQVRDLSHNLMPKKFTDQAFTSLISEYIHTINNSSNEVISLHIHPKETINNLKEIIKVELYKIIQELLTNALKHAKASEINIHITQIDNDIKLLFEDNGVGFKTYELKEGLGFQNIKTRLKNINGKMNIDAYVNRGTIIDIDISL